MDRSNMDRSPIDGSALDCALVLMLDEISQRTQRVFFAILAVKDSPAEKLPPDKDTSRPSRTSFTGWAPVACSHALAADTALPE
jgi:hypothetical protein